MGQGKRLTAVEVKNFSAPGRYGDGAGLYLEVRKDGVKSWLFRFQLRGRRRDMSLGVVTQANGLAAARLAAQDARALIAKGIDPIDARKRPTAIPTFSEYAKRMIAEWAPGWRGARTEDSWTRNLIVHAAKLGPRPIDQVTTEHVMAVLKPYWTAKPDTGGKVRERVERVLDAARAQGVILGAWENPARWRGHLERLLPQRSATARNHFQAMPYTAVAAFLAEIRSQDSMGARALEWTILTAAREGMTRGATWSEIRGDLWVIPKTRMKLGKEHRVPLSDAALVLLERMGIGGKSGLIFPGRKGKPIGARTMDDVLDRMDLDFTVHGFRSTFRDWAGDCTPHAREVIEEALSHRVGDEVERAYRRGDALEKRRALMQDWAAFLARPPVRVSADEEGPEDPPSGSGSEPPA